MVRIGTWTTHSDAVDVAVYDVDGYADALTEQGPELVRNHDRTMPATRAPDGDGQVTFPLAFETRQTKFEQRGDALQKPGGVRLRQHELLYGIRGARQIPELGYEVRIV